MEAAINWLVQGCVVAVAAAGALALLQRSRASVRCAVVWLAWGAVLTLPLIRSMRQILPGVAEPTIILASDSVRITIPVSSGPLLLLPADWWTSPLLAMTLLSTWMLACAVLLARAALAVRTARRSLTPFPDGLERQLPTWTALRARGPRPLLAVSTAVTSAAVLGVRRPVIAIAPALLEQLSPADLDRVVVHEWAHIRRMDHVLNLVLRGGQVVAGWHPAVWYLSRRLQCEREIACDEMAVAAVGSRKAYASTLVTVAALVRHGHSLALPAILGAGRLRHRIASVLSGDRASTPMWARSGALLAAVTVAAAAIGMAHLSAVEVRTFMPAVAARTAATVDIRRAAAAPPSLPNHVPSRAPALVAERIAPTPLRQTDGQTIADAANAFGAGAPDTGVLDEPVSEAAAADRPVIASRAFSYDLPIEATPHTGPAAQPPERGAALSAWSGARTAGAAAADAAAAIGRRSERASSVTARFFDQFGQSVAGAFQP